MIRETFGAQLPPIEESHVGDRFYNTAEDKHYVFDDGEWKAIPETPEPSLPTPTPSDAGKALVVGEDGVFTMAPTGSGVVHCRERDDDARPNPYLVDISNPLSPFSIIKVDRSPDGTPLTGTDIWYGSAITSSIWMHNVLPSSAAFVSPTAEGEYELLLYAEAAARSDSWAELRYVCGVVGSSSPSFYLMASLIYVDMHTGRVYIPYTED